MRYGPGIYFFINGITACPITDAQNWVETHPPKGFVTTRFTVFEASIPVESGSILDLRTREGLETFNAARRRVIEHYADEIIDPVDFLVIKLLNEAVEYKAVISNYIFNPKSVRKTKFVTYVPNSTIFCVCPAAQKCIDGLKVVREGPIAP